MQWYNWPSLDLGSGRHSFKFSFEYFLPPCPWSHGGELIIYFFGWEKEWSHVQQVCTCQRSHSSRNVALVICWRNNTSKRCNTLGIMTLFQIAFYTCGRFLFRMYREEQILPCIQIIFKNGKKIFHIILPSYNLNGSQSLAMVWTQKDWSRLLLCKVSKLSLYKIQTHKRLKRMLIYYDANTRSANFQGNPLCQATKWHLNNSLVVKNNEKAEKWNNLSFWVELCCFLVQCLEECFVQCLEECSSQHWTRKQHSSTKKGKFFHFSFPFASFFTI